MTGDLQDELAVSPFIEKLIGRQTADRPYGPKTEINGLAVIIVQHATEPAWRLCDSRMV